MFKFEGKWIREEKRQGNDGGAVMAADLLGFVVLGFSLSVPVGAITIEMVKRGMHGGFWPAWFVGLGGMSADILLMMLIYFGIAAMLMTAAAQTVMWSIGFIVLVYLGMDSIRAAAAPFDLDPGRREGNKSLAACFWSGFAIAISNPLNIRSGPVVHASRQKRWKCPFLQQRHFHRHRNLGRNRCGSSSFWQKFCGA
jgi:LysE type translocator